MLCWTRTEKANNVSGEMESLNLVSTKIITITISMITIITITFYIKSDIM